MDRDNKGRFFKGGNTGGKHWRWTNENVSYEAIHFWINRNYGKANKCENINCLKLSNKFEWSKIKGKEYERKRENFWMLCIFCHRKYDKAGVSAWNKTNFLKKCNVCHKDFKYVKSNNNLRKHCSRKCYYLSKKGYVPWNKRKV